MNHYPRHIGDILTATVGLTLAERGAYDALIDQYYAREAPLPLDRSEIYRLAVATGPAERRAVDYVVGKFFVEQSDGWHQQRCDEELDIYRGIVDRARVNGLHGGRPRKQNNPEETGSVISGIPRRNPDVTQTKANQEPRTKNQEKHTRRVSAATSLPDRFSISDRVREWAADKGYDRLQERLEHFIGYVKAHGKRYADWDEALMNAIRNDWAHLPPLASEPAKRVAM